MPQTGFFKEGVAYSLQQMEAGMQEQVLFYSGRWTCFDNFSAYAVYWRGVLWMTAEHAYQAAKFTDPVIIALVREARSAHDAKKIGRAHAGHERLDWLEIKVLIMAEILRAKVEQHPYIRKQLLATGDAEIVEDSPKDGFWGRGRDGNGQNQLGKLWMCLRGELRARK